ncbi:hypothetical protein ABH309_20630 [Chromobacterium piscinae]|uniref:Uncharacterized protein n=1 Tax=Chromobacterium piscinae TaxID=686831 RepID=A0ABV0HAJ9_9NEIS|nr:hypothetical protein [Chromobacterium piscinae]MCD4504382.1 hypothetical protein [Chromobacterium piscinae]MCD5329791.1 hypothetical protein [Chromobacterium piscinae]
MSTLDKPTSHIHTTITTLSQRSSRDRRLRTVTAASAQKLTPHMNSETPRMCGALLLPCMMAGNSSCHTVASKTNKATARQVCPIAHTIAFAADDGFDSI